MDILKYYPILFVLGFLVMIFAMYQYSMYKSSRNKKQEKRINSTNKMNRLINNKQPVVNEIELVKALSDDEIVYKGVEDCKCWKKGSGTWW